MVIFIYQNLKLTSSIVNPLTVSDVFVCLCRPIELQGGPKKWGHRLMTIILSHLNRLKNTGRFT